MGVFASKWFVFGNLKVAFLVSLNFPYEGIKVFSQKVAKKQKIRPYASDISS